VVKSLYLLDTCIISEMVKPIPSTSVMNRIERNEGRLVISDLTWHELLFGVNRLPAGKRKTMLFDFLMEVVASGFPRLPYDSHAAWIHADLRTRLEKTGSVLSFVDEQIATIAIVNNLVLVTRNISDFQHIPSLHVENWFEA
jgi:tRNA(fMet)-specific endonuclease VapC